MSLPKVICHMTVSKDWKATGAFLETETGSAACDAYYEVHRNFKADAFACGRVTMIGSFTHGWQPDLTPFAQTEIPDGDYVAQQSDFYAVSFDRRGSLGWQDSHIHDEDPGYDNAHIIEVVCADADKAYLAYLRSIGVSYIIGGETDLDLTLVLEKLKGLFGIELLLLEGGGHLNGSFLQADLIDEISLIHVPVLAGEAETCVFVGCKGASYEKYSETSLGYGCSWRQYRKAEA